MKTPEKKLDSFYEQAFHPMPADASVSAEVRMVYAAEYAAAQLGMIARAVDKIEATLTTPHSPPFQTQVR